MATIKLVGDRRLARQLQRLAAASPQIVEEALRGWAGDVESTAGRTVPVDTAQLRGSIVARVDVGAEEAQVGVWNPQAHYSQFVELGTSSMQAQPFLYPAFLAHRDVRRYVKGALDKHLPT